VAVIRQEGSNGDREMLSSFHAAGLEVRSCDNYYGDKIRDDDDYSDGDRDNGGDDSKNQRKSNISRYFYPIILSIQL
jgi:hypothetical protein